VSGTVQIARTQAEVDFLDGLLAQSQSPVLSMVEGFDPFDQTPIAGPSTPDVCENVL
jgi:hypothetical protein